MCVQEQFHASPSQYSSLKGSSKPGCIFNAPGCSPGMRDCVRIDGIGTRRAKGTSSWVRIMSASSKGNSSSLILEFDIRVCYINCFCWHIIAPVLSFYPCCIISAPETQQLILFQLRRGGFGVGFGIVAGVTFIITVCS